MEATTSKTTKVIFHGTINNHKSAIDFNIKSSTGKITDYTEARRATSFSFRDRFVSNVAMPVSVAGRAEFLVDNKTAILQELHAKYYDKTNMSIIQTISIKHESDDPDNYALAGSISLCGFL